MSQRGLLTPEGAMAIEWVRVRLPHAAFESFTEEMEEAISEICQRYGVDKEVRESFSVKQLVSKGR